MLFTETSQASLKTWLLILKKNNPQMMISEFKKKLGENSYKYIDQRDRQFKWLLFE